MLRGIYQFHRLGHTYNSNKDIFSKLVVDCLIVTDMSLCFSTTHHLQINQATHDQALVLQSALQNIPNPASECMLRNVAIRLAQQISDEVSGKI